LDRFNSYGASPDPAFPPEFEAGEMRAKIELEGLGTAQLVVICVLPEVDVPASAVEGIRVHIGGWHFDEEATTEDPGFSPTLFIRTAD